MAAQSCGTIGPATSPQRTSVMEKRAEVTQVVEYLFPLYMSQPDLLPRNWQNDIAAADTETALARLVSDYIAGMTDRFALQEHARLTGRSAVKRASGN